MADVFTSYELGISRLIDHLSMDKEAYDTPISDTPIRALLVLQQRLERNIGDAQEYGSNPAQESDLNRILDALNTLSLQTTGKGFKKWYESNGSSPIQPLLTPPPTNCLPISTYVKELFDALQKVSDIFDQEEFIYQFQCEDMRRLLQKNNAKLEFEAIPCIVPTDTSQTSLIVILHCIKQCVEEIINLIRAFEPLCEKRSGQKKRQIIRGKLSSTITYIQQSINFIITE